MASRIRGHGHVTPLPSGAVERCGGPEMCSHCALEQMVLLQRGLLESANWDADELLRVLVDLLAVVNIATLEDPSKHRVANTVGGPALAARQVLQKHGRLEALNRRVQDRL